MTDQVFVLLVMIFVGVIGALGFFAPFEEAPKWMRKAGIVWVIVWCAPPLVLLWVKGVFG